MGYKIDFERQPIDAGWGLIMRLNRMWFLADENAMRGDFNKWNSVLDRLYCNLLYKEKMEIVRDEKGNVIKIELSEDDKKEMEKINEDIKKIKIKIIGSLKAKNYVEYTKANEEHYSQLMLKDIWLRKKMFALKLYLKVADSNPSRAIYGY